ncbi:PIN domain-containing protein [Dyadobacter diqingensis]|uniref:PIN domain-containing protein n=1 Tax=Dyadobacter diqingensis TaxID=2938121 RepID=UPI0020C54612|nr:PIN domain-containing protein [Dyadobacter diqingensis]
MENVLIDTDVILDFFFDRQPFSEDAAKILALCESGEIKGFVTPVIYSNAYDILRKTASHQFVVDQLKQLFYITDVLAMDKAVVLQALNSTFSDFEDSLQNFAAVDYGGINAVITRNVKDYKSSTIAVLTPQSFLNIRG